MASPRALSQCGRLFRKHTRNDTAVHFVKIRSSRAFSSQLNLQQKSSQSHNLPQDLPPTPPTTTATITSNITAQPPPSHNPSPDTPSYPTQDGPSTAEMQHTITSSLNRPPAATDLPHALASRLRQTATKTTDTYMAYGISQALFRVCSQQADYTIPESQRQGILTGKGPPKTEGGEDLGLPEQAQSWWIRDLGLQPTFSTWSQVSYLHMYILVVRFRALQHRDSVIKYQQYLLDHFSHAAEDKMGLLHGMTARGIRNRYLKDLFLQWRGLLAAYDEGMVKGDAVLAGAVWRNLWKGREEVDWERVAEVVAFVRRAARLLGEVGDRGIQASVVGEGGGKGGVFDKAKKGLKEQVRRQSRGVRETPANGPPAAAEEEAAMSAPASTTASASI